MLAGRLQHPARRRRSWRSGLAVASAVAIAGLLLGTAGFHLSGGRWFVVRTPSMGTAAPVGTLILTRPSDVRDLRVGDIIAFHPPTEPAETYTHRVVAKTADGVRTRGDINGATDPWTVGDRDLIGRAVLVAPALGWLMRALPLLLIGGLLLWGLTHRWLPVESRGPVRMVGGAVVFAVAATLLRPFVATVQLASYNAGNGTSRISMVSTGLLPIRVRPIAGHGHAAPVDLGTAGDTGVSVLHGHAANGRYELSTHLHLSLWQWVIALVIIAAPTMWTVAVGFRPAHVAQHRSDSAGEPGEPRDAVLDELIGVPA